MIRRKDKWLEVLGRIPLFEGCTRRELELIDRLEDTARAPAGYVLIAEGAPLALEAVLILEGEVEVSRHGETVAVLGPGSLVGEMSLIDHAPRHATVTAKTPITVLALTPNGFSTLMRDVPRVAQRIMEIYGERVCAATSQEAEVVTA